MNCRDIVVSGEVTAAFTQSKRLPGGEGLVLCSVKRYCRRLILANMTENLFMIRTIQK